MTTKRRVELEYAAPGAERVKQQIEGLGEAGDKAVNKMARLNEVAARLGPRLDGAGHSARLSGHQMQQLSFQVNDLVTQMSSGTSVFQAFAQQGGQLTQALVGTSAIAGPLMFGVTALIGGIALLRSRTEEAADAQERYNKVLEEAAKVSEAARNAGIERSKSLQAEARYLVELAMAEVAALEAKVAARRQDLLTQTADVERRAAFAGGPTPSPEVIARAVERDAQLKQLDNAAKAARVQVALLRATLGEFNDGRARFFETLDIAAFKLDEKGKRAKKAARASQEHKDAEDDVRTSVEAHIRALAQQNDLLRLEESERAKVEAVMRAQAIAMAQGNLLTAEQIEQIRALVDENRALAAAAGERRRAEQESSRAAENARKAAERALEERARAAERATDDVVRYAGDAFADLFGDTEDGWRKMWDNMADWARRTLARIAAEMVLRPVIAPVIGSIMGVPAAAAAGTGGAAGGSTGLGIGDIAGVGQLLSASSLNSFGASLGFSPGTAVNHALAVDPSLVAGGYSPGAAAAPAPGGIFGATTFTQFLGGAAAGFGVGTLLGSLFGMSGKGNTIGSGVGSLAGAAIGSIFGGPLIGGIIGGAAGGLLGGLFKKKPKDAEFQLITTAAQRGGLNSIQGPFGWVGENSFKTKGWDELGLVRATAEIDRRAAAFLSEAEIAAVGNVLQTTPAKLQKEKTLDEGDFADALRDRYGTVLRTLGAGGSALERMASAPRTAEDTARVLQELLAERGAIRDLIELTGEMGEISKTVADQVTAVTETIDKLGQSTEDWGFEAGKVAEAQRRVVEEFLGMREAAEPMSETARALALLEKRFEEAAALARQVGISEAELAEAREQALVKLTEGFDEGVRRQLLGLTDPLALALEDWEKLAEQRLADARLAGANLVEVERLNAIERQKILEQYGSGLRSLIDELRFGELGGLSPTARLEDLRAEIGLAAALGDRSRFEQLARGFLEGSRGANASGAQFQADRDWVLAVAQGFLGAVPEAANGNAPVVAAIDELGQRLAVETARGNASMTAGIDRLNRQMAAMTETIARQQAALDRIAAKLARVA